MAKRGSPPRATHASLRRELEKLFAKLTSDLLALVDRAVDQALSPAGRREPKPRARRNRAALDALGQDILVLLREGTPRSVGELARPLGARPSDLAHPLRLLITEAKIRQIGTKRGARYVAVASRASARPPAKPASPDRKRRAKR